MNQYPKFVFSGQKLSKSPILRAIFFLETGQGGCKKPKIFADFRSEEIVQKNARKKVRPKNHFFCGLGRDFVEKQIFGIIFSQYFFSQEFLQMWCQHKFLIFVIPLWPVSEKQNLLLERTSVIFWHKNTKSALQRLKIKINIFYIFFWGF